MEYLRTHALASAPAIVIICRQLATRGDAIAEATLRKMLQPDALKSAIDVARDDEANDALPASLKVSEDIGLLKADGGKDRRWRLADDWAERFAADPMDDSGPLLNLVAQRVGSRAVAAVEAGEVTDVALALTWLLMRDPFTPLSTNWGDGAEMAFGAAGRVGRTVQNSTQWGALRRWARALGLATEMPAARSKHRLVVDPTTLVRRTLSALPGLDRAESWLNHLRGLQPLLGDRTLVAAVGGQGADAAPLSASLALALMKLDKAGDLRLVRSDDARDAVVLRVGERVMQIGEIHVIGGAR